MGSDLTREVAEAKGTLKEIDRLRRQDIDTAIARIKEGLSPEGLTKGLLGPGGFAKLEKALGWIERARALNEKGQRKGSPPPRARIGRDVPFPFHHRWPTFHLMKATLSGETPGGLAYEGTLMDVTSDPKLLGKPSLLNLSGQAGERALTVLASLDLTTKTPSETVNATYIGLPLKELKLGEIRGTPISIQEGSGAINIKFQASGPALDGTIHLKAANMKVGRLVSDKTDRVTAAVENVLAKITEASIGVDVAGTIKNPRFSLNSTLDNQLRAAVKKALEEEVANLRADVEKEVARLLDKETEKFSQLINTSAGPALEKINLGEKKLGSGEDQIQKALDELAQRGTKSLKLPDIKGLFKKN